MKNSKSIMTSWNTTTLLNTDNYYMHTMWMALPSKPMALLSIPMALLSIPMALLSIPMHEDLGLFFMQPSFPLSGDTGGISASDWPRPP
jgi:hypothetical protein